MRPRSPNIHERFLRHVWSQQYLNRTNLRTVDGSPLRVLEAGTLNAGAGPDFLNARLVLDGTVFVGDVEIHRNVAEWLQHRHHEDPRYNRLILHVVLEGDVERFPTVVASGRTVPVLLLEPFLSDSLRALWQKTILDEQERRTVTIKCFKANANVEPSLLRRWLGHLSVERLELKLRRFDERLTQLARERLFALREPLRRYGELPVEGFPEEIPPPYGELTAKDYASRELWDQVLYEGLMEGLGYSKNQEPFSRLAQNVTLQRARHLGVADDPVKVEALLFGAAGLLPKVRTLNEKASRDHARTLIRAWNEIRPAYRAELLHAGDWQFFPTRPANFPTIRLAAGAGLLRKLVSEELFRSLVQCIKSAAEADQHRMMQSLFHIETTDFWRTHYHFDEAASRPVQPLGRARIDELIANVVLPIALLYARVFKDRSVREGALRFYAQMPPLPENSLTRLMDRQLLRGRVPLNTVEVQQGVIQLYKFYCSEERCDECEVGKVVFKNS